MKNIQENQEPTPGRHGGARPGAGRKPGTTNKISAQAIIDSLEHHLGVPYADQLAVNYLDALSQNDRTLRASYDRLFLSKIVADKVDVGVDLSEDAIQAKSEAFAAALRAMQNRSQESDNS